MKKALVYSLVALSALVVFSAPLSLADTSPIGNVTIPGSPADSGGLNATLGKVFNVVFGVLILIASFMLLYAAFEYLTSQGDEEKVKKARDMIVYAVVAVIVAVLAWGLPKVVLSFFV